MARMRRVRGTHRSCGPFVGALILGITTDRAARLIGAKRPNHRGSRVHAIRVQWLFDVLKDHGVKCRLSSWYKRGNERSLHRWLLTEACTPRYRDRFILVKTDNHLLMVHNGRVVDNGERRWRTHRAFARSHYGGRLDHPVLEWWVLQADRLPVRRRG